MVFEVMLDLLEKTDPQEPPVQLDRQDHLGRQDPRDPLDRRDPRDLQELLQCLLRLRNPRNVHRGFSVIWTATVSAHLMPPRVPRATTVIKMEEDVCVGRLALTVGDT
jgi:hypothetical protein